MLNQFLTPKPKVMSADLLLPIVLIIIFSTMFDTRDGLDASASRISPNCVFFGLFHNRSVKRTKKHLVHEDWKVKKTITYKRKKTTGQSVFSQDFLGASVCCRVSSGLCCILRTKTICVFNKCSEKLSDELRKMNMQHFGD